MPKELDYEKLGVKPPTTSPHGTEAEIKSNMIKMTPTKWRQEGNQLIGESELGVVAQTIPTDYILQGTDEKGLPILVKLDI